MISRILVRGAPNFPCLEMHTRPGFTVISGASGSGKSVFIGALLSAFGLKDPTAELIEVTLSADLKELGIDLEESGIADYIQGQTTVSLLKRSNTRYFINRQAISKKRLSELAKRFIHHISVKDASELDGHNLLRVLDGLVAREDSCYSALLASYEASFKEFKECQKELAALEAKERNIENLRDFAKFEIERIERVAPSPGEYDRLMPDKKLLSKREKILHACQEALLALDSLDSVQKVAQLLELDLNSFEAAMLEAREAISAGLESFQRLELDPEAMLERLSLLADINRRYGSEALALEHLESQKRKLEEYDNLSFNKEAMLRRYEKLAFDSKNLALELHNKRLASLPLLEDELNDFARRLKLGRISFELGLAMPESSLDEEALSVDEASYLGLHGASGLEILLDLVPKSSLSSGEYNRVRLSMLCMMAKLDSVDKEGVARPRGVLILDEIDANLSGEESEGVARLLSLLSSSYQVFAISHQSFMPLFGDWHYLVSRTGAASQLSLLDEEGRAGEIARIISGSNLNEEALDYARRLLKNKRLN